VGALDPSSWSIPRTLFERANPSPWLNLKARPG
jgi:hypothetical protein